MLRTLTTGIAALRLIALNEGVYRPTDLADGLGITRGRCYHLIRTLINEGMVSRRTDGTLELGPYALGLRQGLLLSTNPVDPATLLAEAGKRTGETVYMALLLNDRVVVARTLDGVHNVRVGSLTLGFSGAPHARASAQAVLAGLEFDQIRRIVGPEPFTRLTQSTVDTYASLTAKLKEVQLRGYAVELGEFQPDIGCVAVPLISIRHTTIGSIAISAPVSRMESRQRSYGEILVEIVTNYKSGSEGRSWTD